MKFNHVRAGAALASLLLLAGGGIAYQTGYGFVQPTTEETLTTDDVPETDNPETTEESEPETSVYTEETSDFTDLADNSSLDGSHAHTFTVLETAANCTTDGSRTYMCDECGYTYTEVIPATGHMNVVESTSRNGNILTTAHTCTDCGLILNTSSVDLYADHANSDDDDSNDNSSSKKEPSTSEDQNNDSNSGNNTSDQNDTDQDQGNQEKPHTHTYTSEITLKPTCTLTGTETFTCACGDTYEVSLPATGHTWEAGNIVDPTCIEDGIMYEICACGAEREAGTIPATGHNFVLSSETAATCEEDGMNYYVCDVCGETKEETVPAAGHQFERIETQAETCTFDGYTLDVCNVCGKEDRQVIPAHGHTEGDWETIQEPTEDNEGIRVKKCTECGVTLDSESIPVIEHEHKFETEIEHVDATCEEDGHILYQCTCGETKEETLPATGHDEGTWITVKEPNYTEMGKEELRCGKCNTLLDSRELDVIPHEHDYETTAHQDATCTEDGFDTLVCSICHDQKTEVIQATGHTESGMVEVTAATCEKDGLKQNTCTVCGTVLGSETIPATGHTESGMIEVTPAGCENNGLKQNTCTVCGTVLGTETIPATGHNYGGFVTTVEPGCEENGVETSTCANCGDTIERSIPAIGHNYGDWIVEEEPTEDSEGLKYKECANCGNRITEDIPPIEQHVHDYAETDRVESTCTAAGYITYTCSGCGESYNEPLALAAHTPGEWVTVSEPTEEAEGLKQQNCTVCGTVVAEESIPKLEHTHSYEKTVTDATCTEDGKIVYTCACGDSYEEVIKATGHQYGEPMTENATCEDAGSITRTCEICGHKDVTEIPATGHAYKQTAIKEATCEQEGSVTYTCENCNDSYTETLPQKDHEYYELSRQDATCTKDGKVIKVCDYCGDTLRETIPATGHDEGEWVTTKEPELGVNGEKSRKCTKCGYILETRPLDMLLTDGTDSVYYVTLDDGSKVMVIGHIDTARADAMFDKINAYRQENGLQALARATDLTDFAQTRAIEITQLFDHVRPDGSELPNIGENIAMNYSTSDLETSVNDTFTQWKNSSGHNANMLSWNPVRNEPINYKSMEIGCFIMRETKDSISGPVYQYSAYWVTNFKL